MMSGATGFPMNMLAGHEMPIEMAGEGGACKHDASDDDARRGFKADRAPAAREHNLHMAVDEDAAGDLVDDDLGNENRFRERRIFPFHWGLSSSFFFRNTRAAVACMQSLRRFSRSGHLTTLAAENNRLAALRPASTDCRPDKGSGVSLPLLSDVALAFLAALAVFLLVAGFLAVTLFVLTLALMAAFVEAISASAFPARSRPPAGKGAAAERREATAGHAGPLRRRSDLLRSAWFAA